MKRKDYFIADFETTSSKFYDANGYTKVWLWSVCDNKGDIVKDGYDIESFMDWLIFNNSKLVYFHNASFDTSYIIDYLEENGFVCCKELPPNGNHHYEVLINDLGVFYSMKIKYQHRIGKKVVRNTIEIRDSLKLIPLKVKAIAKAFGLPIEKEIIDYEDYEVTEEKLHYVHNDVKIVAYALKYFYAMGFDRLTIGSVAFHDYKDYINDVFNKEYGKQEGDRIDYFSRVFPTLDRQWLTIWRNAYTGGRSQVNPKYASKIVNDVKRFDINSMYPSILASARGEEIPYGQPHPIMEREMGKYKFELYHFKASFFLMDGHLPTLLASKGHTFDKGLEKYYIQQDVPIDLYISNIDFEVMKRHYIFFDLEFVEGWGFNTSTKLFDKWIMKYYDLKAEMDRQGNKALKTLYKLIINNIYGKFGSNHQGKSKMPYFNVDDNKVKYVVGKVEDMACYYLPVAIAVTSYAHRLIDDAILKVGYDNFIYCDTDSVHTIGELPNDWVDQEIIGLFKLEGIEQQSKYIRPKTYTYKEGKDWNITCAGMTDDLKRFLLDTEKDNVINKFEMGLEINLDDLAVENSKHKKADGKYEDGFIPYQAKLSHKVVKGGIILKPIPFTLTK